MAETPSERMKDHANLERLAARVLVIGGGGFWMIAAFAGPYVFKGTSVAEAVSAAMLPFFAAAVILAIGWVHEHLAAFMLSVASAAVVVWGVLYGWEIGVWILMVLVLIAPMSLAALLFLLASRSEARRLASAEETTPVGSGAHRSAESLARVH